MKGIILAGGTGSRLLPLTKVTNKHLLPVGMNPMIVHAVTKLVEAGILEILIVTGKEHMGAVVNLLGSGSDYNCQFCYKVQDEAGGIAEALGLAENFCNGSKSVVILGDNIFEDSLVPYVEAFSNQNEGARLILKEVDHPNRFGVAELNGDKVVAIQEKPKIPKSKMAVTGIYFYDAAVFDFVKKCSPSKRGELEITDVNNFYIESGNCEFNQFQGWWTDAGTIESYRIANDFVWNEISTLNTT
ncbi:NTP transferase domain-containing protein [bacterium]|nr:NTP transferase domain-containing protein [bacterium]